MNDAHALHTGQPPIGHIYACLRRHTVPWRVFKGGVPLHPKHPKQRRAPVLGLAFSFHKNDAPALHTGQSPVGRFYVGLTRGGAIKG